MYTDLKHLQMLLKAASSWNLFNNNPMVFKVAVNDYRYYKSKFLLKYKKSDEVIEDKSGAQEVWGEIKHPYDGKVKYGFKMRKQENWHNVSWINK